MRTKHPSPALVIDVEVILHYPPLRDLQMPAVIFLVSDGDQDAGRFPAFDNGHDLVRLGFPEVGIHEFVAPRLGRFQNGSTPFLRTVHDPVLELPGDIAKHLAAHQSAQFDLLDRKIEPERLRVVLLLPVRVNRVDIEPGGLV
jgi:hypothetical protein